MPNIKTVSDLRNYNEVLKGIIDGYPVFLTKNGRAKFVIMDIEEYEKTQATMKLLAKLIETENRVESNDEWMNEEQVKGKLGV